MKNTFGQSLTVTLFGESHGPAVGAVLDGLAPGLIVEEKEIERQLERRRPAGLSDTARREADTYRILSGVMGGRTTGTPLCIVIPNEDVKSSDYEYGKARPSHADYTAFCKYHGFEDHRGGGHFSGRITAALCAAAGILLPALARRGIVIGTHILRCGGASDRTFADVGADIAYLTSAAYPTLDADAGQAIRETVLNAREKGDSVGGETQTAVLGLPTGLGEPWFDSVEGTLSHILFSIGGIKGVSFGKGFDFCSSYGSEANDALRLCGGRVVTGTNHNGGINGGITNGMPVIFQCAVKPTPSIAQSQKTVDFLRMEETELCVSGRHDPSIVRRICPVIDAVTAIALCDMLAQRYGTDWLAGGEDVHGI